MSRVAVAAVKSQADLDEVRRLCRAFRAGQFERYADQAERISLYYGEKEYEEMLTRLMELHAPPAGLLLLAKVEGEAAGCVMYGRVDDETCEMKRMFVDPDFRGKGVGHALGAALISGARDAGYRRMRLDTGPRQHEAVALYRRLGFSSCEPYAEDGPKWPDKVYMDMELTVG